LTFSCYQRSPLLSEQMYCVLLSQSIDRAIKKQEFELITFVYMPEHVHMIVFPVTPEARVARLLFGIKRPFSTRAKQLMLQTDELMVRRLTIRERPGRSVFRFWQEGGGYDRNITNEDTLRRAVEYLHNNPVRRGLCKSPDRWKWSSWPYYFEPDRWPDPDLPEIHGFPG